MGEHLPGVGLLLAFELVRRERGIDRERTVWNLWVYFTWFAANLGLFNPDCHSGSFYARSSGFWNS